MATPNFFATLGIDLQRGRDFDAQDHAEARRVAIVNRSLADELWPGEEAVGRRLIVDLGGEGVDYEVVGQVADVRRRGLAEPPRREFYVPHAQRPYLIMNLAIRVDGAVAPFIPRIRETILELDPSQPPHSVSALTSRVNASVADQRAMALLVGLLGAVALGLAGLGVYGALALWVSQHGREIGIRRALGARDGQISRQLLRATGLVLLAGLAGGGLLALGAGRLIESLLYGIDPRDPLAFLIAPLALLAVGALASWLPLRRALTTDPARTLRRE